MTNKTATTTQKKSKQKTTTTTAALLELPVTQRGLEQYAAHPEDIIGKAADSQATVILIPLERVIESGDNARRTFDETEIEGLAQNIRAVGLRDAIEVRPRGEKDGGPAKYELVDGARRYRAFQLLYKVDPDRFAEIPAFVRNDDELTTAVVRAAKNHQRVNLTPYEEALDFQNILKRGEGVTIDQVAGLVGKSPATVKSRLKLLEVPETVARLIGQGGATLQHAEALVPIFTSPLTQEARDVLAKHAASLLNPARNENVSSPTDTVRRLMSAAEKEAGLVELTDWETRRVTERDAAFKKYVEGLDTLKVKAYNGHEVYAKKTPAFVKEFEAAKKRLDEKDAKDRAKFSGGSSDSYARAERQKLQVYRGLRVRSREGIVKAAKAIVQFDDRARDLLVLALLNRANVSKNAKIIAEATGLDVKVLGNLNNDSVLIKLIEDLRKKKDRGATLARLATTAALVDMSESLGTYNLSGSVAWNHAAKTWIGGDMKRLAEKVKKDLKATKKKGSKAKAPRGRAKAAADNEDVDDGEE